MKKTVWHSGPPPSLGWWPASVARDKTILRWWNGKYWSDCVGEDTEASLVARAAKKRSVEISIEWTDRPASWPERSKT